METKSQHFESQTNRSQKTKITLCVDVLVNILVVKTSLQFLRPNTEKKQVGSKLSTTKVVNERSSPQAFNGSVGALRRR